MCEHNHIIGDNYGETCQECGAIIHGYGYGGWFGSNLTGEPRECIHLWIPFENNEYEVCSYCYEERKIVASLSQNIRLSLDK